MGQREQHPLDQNFHASFDWRVAGDFQAEREITKGLVARKHQRQKQNFPLAGFVHDRQRSSSQNPEANQVKSPDEWLSRFNRSPRARFISPRTACGLATTCTIDARLSETVDQRRDAVR